MKRIIILAAAASCLSACASLGQAVTAYGSVAVTGAKVANDTLIEANKAALCAIPLSALARHRELVPAVKSLCLQADDHELAALLDLVVTSPK